MIEIKRNFRQRSGHDWFRRRFDIQKSFPPLWGLTLIGLASCAGASGDPVGSDSTDSTPPILLYTPVALKVDEASALTATLTDASGIDNDKITLASFRVFTTGETPHEPVFTVDVQGEEKQTLIIFKFAAGALQADQTYQIDLASGQTLADRVGNALPSLKVDGNPLQFSTDTTSSSDTTAPTLTFTSATLKTDEDSSLTATLSDASGIKSDTITQASFRVFTTGENPHEPVFTVDVQDEAKQTLIIFKFAAGALQAEQTYQIDLASGQTLADRVGNALTALKVGEQPLQFATDKPTPTDTTPPTVTYSHKTLKSDEEENLTATLSDASGIDSDSITRTSFTIASIIGSTHQPAFTIEVKAEETDTLIIFKFASGSLQSDKIYQINLASGQTLKDTVGNALSSLLVDDQAMLFSTEPKTSTGDDTAPPRLEMIRLSSQKIVAGGELNLDLLIYDNIGFNAPPSLQAQAFTLAPPTLPSFTAKSITALQAVGPNSYRFSLAFDLPSGILGEVQLNLKYTADASNPVSDSNGNTLTDQTFKPLSLQIISQAQAKDQQEPEVLLSASDSVKRPGGELSVWVTVADLAGLELVTSLNKGFFSLRQGEETVIAANSLTQLAFSSNSRVMKFQLSFTLPTDLSGEQTYALHYQTGSASNPIRDRYGNALSDKAIGQITIGIDATKPTLTENIQALKAGSRNYLLFTLSDNQQLSLDSLSSPSAFSLHRLSDPSDPSTGVLQQMLPLHQIWRHSLKEVIYIVAVPESAIHAGEHYYINYHLGPFRDQAGNQLDALRQTTTPYAALSEKTQLKLESDDTDILLRRIADSKLSGTITVQVSTLDSAQKIDIR